MSSAPFVRGVALPDGQQHQRLSVDGYIRLSRKAEAWPGRLTWEPFWMILFPTYSFGAVYVLSPVFFNPHMRVEWLSHLPDEEAGFALSVASMGMFGCWMLGAVLWTRVADRIGRRPAALAAGWSTVAVSAATVLAWSYGSFVALRSALGLAIGGQAACAYVLTIEWSLQRDAALLTMLGNALFSVSSLLLVLVAYIGDVSIGIGWRGQQLLLCALNSIPLAFGMWLQVRRSP